MSEAGIHTPLHLNHVLDICIAIADELKVLHRRIDRRDNRDIETQEQVAALEKNSHSPKPLDDVIQSINERLDEHIALICGLERTGRPKTLRDEFAGRALTGILASTGISKGSSNLPQSQVAEYSYRIADAMIAERSRHSFETTMSEIHAREAKRCPVPGCPKSQMPGQSGLKEFEAHVTSHQTLLFNQKVAKGVVAREPECYSCGQPPSAPVHDPKYGSHLFVTPHEFIEACATCRERFPNPQHNVNTVACMKAIGLTIPRCDFVPSGQCFLCHNPKDASVHTQPAAKE